jgi:hypothetical protein
MRTWLSRVAGTVLHSMIQNKCRCVLAVTIVIGATLVRSGLRPVAMPYSAIRLARPDIFRVIL